MQRGSTRNTEAKRAKRRADGRKPREQWLAENCLSRVKDGITHKRADVGPLVDQALAG
jgi:hypothetical protein